MDQIFSYIISGIVVYIISVLFKYFVKISWAVINWIAEKYISNVLNAEVTGESMVDYIPAKEVFKIRKAIKKNNGR